MSASSRARGSLLVAAVAALSLGGLVVPAQAAGSAAAAVPASLQFQVVDSATGRPIAGIAAQADEEGSDRLVDFNPTDTDGRTDSPSGTSGDRLVAGTYDISFYDNDPDRYDADTTYASLTRTAVTVQAGANDLGQVSLDPGATVSGTARTPSGHLLRQLLLFIEPVDQGYEPGFGFAQFTGDDDATYDENGLGTGHFTTEYQSGIGTNLEPGPSFDVSQPGQHVTLDLSVKVNATYKATSLTGSSPSKGTARLVFRVASTTFGITDPHGVVTFTSAQGKVLGAPVPVRRVDGKGQATITFPASSTSHNYVASYGDGPGNVADLLDTSRTVRVVVK